MNKKPIAIGVDVAKATLSVCLLFQDGTTEALSIRNTETDITRKCIVKLKGFTGKIIMEATGHYHWLVATLATEAGYDVRTVNPLLATKYTRASIRKVKNDPADAATLASMALVEQDLPQPFHATRQHLVLRKKIGFIATLRSQIQSMKASQRSIREAQSICDQELTETDIAVEQAIKNLETTIKKLEQEFEESVLALTAPETIERLTSIPGVSRHVAALTVHWFSLDGATSAKSWIGYAGLDISTRQSGTWHGKTRLTKRGNNYLRRRLYCAAWGAVMHDEQFKSWYKHLREEGCGHVEALVIIARKIVRILYAVTKHQTLFDASKPLFSVA